MEAQSYVVLVFEIDNFMWQHLVESRSCLEGFVGFDESICLTIDFALVDHYLQGLSDQVRCLRSRINLQV